MSSEVYYRKWRPQGFNEVVGQEHVTTTLARAVNQGRVGHSYLFCGPRGTGKTSTARILAKAVNCLSSGENQPCGSCSRCTAVQEGRYLDLIEMDAASNRGIDEIRSIRDKVNLAPVEGRYKVYIIDEAHMLTDQASNAFLKTLEEPPPHVIFTLCTTEAHKILPTIISRCQRFDFRRLTSEAMVDRLRVICTEEGVDADTPALKILAHTSGGSLRDAENLLEQLVVSYGGKVGVAEVNQMLGLGQEERALEFIRYLLTGNTTSAVASISRAAWDGVDLRQFHREAVDLLRSLLLVQCGSKESLDMSAETSHDIEDLAHKVPISATMLSLRHLAPVNMRFDSPSPLPLELAVVEISLDGASQGASTPALSAPAPEPRPVPRPSNAGATSKDTGPARTPDAPGSPTPMRGVPSGPSTNHQDRQADPPLVREDLPDSAPVGAGNGTTGSFTPTPAPSDGPSEGLTGDQWSLLIRALSRFKGKRFNIGALLRDCKNQRLDGDTLVLAFSHRSHLERMQEEMDDPQGLRIVEQAMTKSLGTVYRLRLDMTEGAGASGPSASNQSPLVRAALNWGGRVLEEREE